VSIHTDHWVLHECTLSSQWCHCCSCWP